MPVQRIPDGYTGVTSYLIVRDAAQALDFYRQAFGATETMRLTNPFSADIRGHGSKVKLNSACNAAYVSSGVDQ